MAQPQNFQPQVRDTSSGPNVHTYIPRDDGSFTINGVTFLPQSGLPTAATIPVTSAGIPIATPVPAQPWVVQPGGPAVPAVVAFPVQLTPQIYPFNCNYFPLQSGTSGFDYSASPFPYPYYQLASATKHRHAFPHLQLHPLSI